MNSQFSPNVSEVLYFSREEAMRLSSSSVGPEHLMLGILRERDENIEWLLNNAHIDKITLKTELETAIKSQQTDNESLQPNDITLNEQASNIMRLAVLEARKLHQQKVEVYHILLAMIHPQVQSLTKTILHQHEITYDSTIALLTRSIIGPTDSLDLPEDEDDDDEILNGPENTNRSAFTKTASKSDSDTPLLDNFSTDLTKAAAEGKLDPVVGREKEIMRVSEILCRRKKNNPILIGEPGVGKSAIVEGLAQLIVNRKTSPILFNKRLISLDMAGMVAGTKYRGQFEERVRTMLKELEKNPDIIVFIDEIHTLIGAGSTPGSMDAANMMKPALARGQIQCIGATTLDEYRNSIEKDGALERRFQKVLVEATTVEETTEILNNIKERYEKHHHVKYSDEAIQACVKLTDRYITDRFFPDKAIDAMDEAGAHVHLQHAEISPEIASKEKEIAFIKDKKIDAVKRQNFELAAGYRDRQVELEKELKELQEKWDKEGDGHFDEVTENDVADTVSRMTGVPVQRVVESEGIRIKGLSDALKSSVIAQDPAIDKLVKAIQRNRAGLRELNHPIGVFMFLGPTGVGKTYLAKKLAEYMFGSTDALIRIDMSEYTESFNVSRLIGAPPGYVGYEEGGQLTERVRRHPYSIVLLDEIEKAHANVFNLLLQVLDEGRLTDGNGRLVDFRNTVIIMTSNAGTRQLKEFGRGIGFTATNFDSTNLNEQDKQYARSIIQKSLSKQFAPEFLNRLDEIITFDQLDLKAIRKIVDIELSGLQKRVEDLGYKIEISDEARDFLATKGYDVQFGARPLKRAVQTYIEDGLSEMLINDTLKEGYVIHIDKHPTKDELTFT